MKALSVIGLLFVAAIIATVPISPQVTPRGLELSVDQLNLSYLWARSPSCPASDRIARRADRQSYRYARRAGYGAAIYGSASYGYRVVAAGPGR